MLTRRLLLPGAVVLFVAAIVVQGQEPGSMKLTLELLYDPDEKVDFDGSPPRIRGWLKDGRHYVELKSDGEDGRRLVKVEARSGKSEPLYDLDRLQADFGSLAEMTNEEAAELAQDGTFELSPDETAVLIAHRGDLYYYEFDPPRALRLTATGEEEKEPDFSPDGRMVAFNRGHDLYVVDVRRGRERRLTSSGSENRLNGLLDWVYQEEVYGRGDFRGYWWSPDSRHIAFLQLDESPVPSFTVIDHMAQHLEQEVTRYPKAGDPNPNVRLGMVDVGGGKPVWVDLSHYDPADLLIVRVGWAPDGGTVLFQAQNREQTWLELNSASVGRGSVVTLIRESSPAWVNVLDQPHWMKDGTFLWSSEGTGWRHLYHYAAGGQLIGPVTQGEWEVRSLHGVDQGSGWVYFSATERSSIDLDIYRVRLDGSRLTRISEKAGNHRASFNDDLTLFIDSWSDINTPVQTRLHDAGGTTIRVIDPNPATELEKYRLSRPELLQVKTRDGFVMEAMMIRPPDFDPSRKYPVLSNTYAGPQSPRVSNRWGGTTYLWHQLLAQKGYVIWICDNRTASGKGAQSTWPAHRNLGELELRDIEDGLAWLKSRSWVDGSRIGLWGWSYGGYMTSYALTHSQSFKIGIVGAPVTDWSLYDTIYTERYMGTPQNNPEGYEKSSVLKAAGNLHGTMLLLHGTMDDNVHLQNSIQLMYELQKAGKDFQVMFYPQSRHGVRTPALVLHMRRLMTRFIEENL